MDKQKLYVHIFMSIFMGVLFFVFLGILIYCIIEQKHIAIYMFLTSTVIMGFLTSYFIIQAVKIKRFVERNDKDTNDKVEK